MCSLSRSVIRPVVASALFLLASGAGLTRSEGQVATSGTGVVRHAVSLTGSNRVEGSLQILTGETSSFGGTAVVTGDLLVPGTPTVQFGGNPIYGGTLQGTGSTQPSNYAVTGDGRFPPAREMSPSPGLAIMAAASRPFAILPSTAQPGTSSCRLAPMDHSSSMAGTA
jgi:hypothetical protein